MRPKVFLLEDDPTLSRLISGALQDEGWTCHAAFRAANALGELRRFKPDLAVLDVSLPDGDGVEVCRGLREEPELGGVPVLFLTSKNDLTSRLRGFEAGGQDYIGKPCAMREIVARVRAHLELKRRSDRLAAENGTVLLRERLVRDVADMILHDLRSPLATVRLTLQLLRDSGLLDGSQFEKTLGAAKTAADMSLLIASDFLDLSAGRIEPKPAPVDLPALLGRLRTILGAQYQRRGVELKIEADPDLPPLRSDATVLFRVMTNFLSNALKASRKGQSVRLRIRGIRGNVRFEVEDEGPGIPDDEKGRIFDKFYRARRGRKTSVPGAGIGLAFCRLAAESLRGRVWVEDRDPKGSRFVFQARFGPGAPPWDRKLRP